MQLSVTCNSVPTKECIFLFRLGELATTLSYMYIAHLLIHNEFLRISREITLDLVLVNAYCFLVNGNETFDKTAKEIEQDFQFKLKHEHLMQEIYTDFGSSWK